VDVEVDERRFGHGRSIVAPSHDDALERGRCKIQMVPRPRLVPLAVVVTLLVVVVAIVAAGRPLGTHGGKGGLPLSFWDYVYTTSLIVGIPLLLAMGIAAMFVRGQRRKPQSLRTYIIRSVLILSLLIPLEWFVVRHLRSLRLRGHQPPQPLGTGTVTTTTNPGSSAANHSLHFRWGELLVVLAALLLLGAIVAVRTRSGPKRRLEIAPEVLAAALDESLDDLRADPDLRRAIIAAYARMEAALAAAGIPREPAEAPLEYVERALLTLDTSANAVRRLTDLFEWARFSHHEPEPSMRDDAVDALVAVRDELRASEPVPA
jgi:hypothetical protein